MASAKEAADPRTSLRRFRAAHGGAGAKIKPAFAVDDDSDDEGSLTVQRVSYKGRVRRRNVARQVPFESESGIQTGGASATATASTEGPFVTSGSAEGPRPTSLVESITASLSDGTAPTSPPAEDSESDDDGDHSDSDSEDESSTWKPTQRPTGTFDGIGPSGTASDPLPASSTASIPDSDATASAARVAQQKHHQEVETALIVVGCVAGLICIGIGIWFFIRRRARRNRDPDSASPSKLRHFKLPFVSSRDRAWEELTDEKLYGNEKDVGMSGSELLGYLPDKPPAAAAAPFPARRMDEKGYQGDTFGHNTTTFIRTSQTEAQPYSPTETSLSSGFGNGTYIPPTPLHPPPRVQIDPPPIPSDEPAQRDTIYTQASEASSVPRFRTVNSWVRQQTRKKAEDVPEQGYGLMSPDEQMPRRVQWNIVRPEGVGFARG